MDGPNKTNRPNVPTLLFTSGNRPQYIDDYDPREDEGYTPVTIFPHALLTPSTMYGGYDDGCIPEPAKESARDSNVNNTNYNNPNINDSYFLRIKRYVFKKVYSIVTKVANKIRLIK